MQFHGYSQLHSLVFHKDLCFYKSHFEDIKKMQSVKMGEGRGTIEKFLGVGGPYINIIQLWPEMTV